MSYKNSFEKLAVIPLSVLAIVFSPLAVAVEDAGGFDQLLELQGISFHVLCPNQGSINPLEIIPAGLETDNAAIQREIDGTVTGAEVADLRV